jgi:hypothetical protein
MMRIPRWLMFSAAVAAAGIVSGAAGALGPWPGLAPTVRAPAGDVFYSASTAGGVTTVERISHGSVAASTSIDGAYGIPAVTSTGIGGGLSPDGRLLVLAEPPHYESLRAQSRFLVLSTDTLGQVSQIVLRGEYGFDAISPDRGTLYLIQHISNRDLVRYVVRAYDLRAGRLLPGVIADKRNINEAMRGYPVARATSARGAWVYTLYNRPFVAGLPFVHALNAAGRSAFCVDLPRWPKRTNIWEAHLQLTSGGKQLIVRAPGGAAVARIDTKTLSVQ